MVKGLVFLLIAVLATGVARAEFRAVPKDALKFLQVTKGAPCRKGVVFVNGKYIPPPYVVKRYGTALMINGIQVSNPLISWERFLQTQSGVVSAKSPGSSAASGGAVQAVTSATPVAPAKSSEKSSASAVDDDPLADLFDDEPKRPAKKPAKSASSAPRAEAPTIVLPSDFRFEMNKDAKALLDRLNRQRTEINVLLMRGDFIFFGENYSRVTGDVRETKRLMSKLPDALAVSTSAEALFARLRKEGFQYLSEPVIRDLFQNRSQYLQLRSRFEYDYADTSDFLGR